MADYIVLTTDSRNNSSRVVIHSITPIGTNEVGKTFAQAIVDERATPTFTSAVPASELPGGRQVALDNGTVFEWEKNIDYNANDLPAAKQAVIEAEINATEPQMLEDIQDRMRFYGFVGTS